MEINGPPVGLGVGTQTELDNFAQRSDYPLREKVVSIEGKFETVVELPTGRFEYVVFREQSVFNDPTSMVREADSNVELRVIAKPSMA